MARTRLERQLPPDQEAELRAWLAAHPEMLADWEKEAALNEGLARLPNVVVASNFTSRVLLAVQREAAAEEAHHRRRRPWLAWRRRSRWIPRVVFGSIVVGAGLISYHQVLAVQRAQIARSVATVSDATSLPGPGILKDFYDAICALDGAQADVQLLQLLK